MREGLNIFYDLILPGLIALIVSLVTTLITIYLNNKIKRKNELKNSILNSCKRIQAIIYGNSPHWGEDEFMEHYAEIEYLVTESGYYDSDFSSSIMDKMKNLKYQYTDLTKEAVEENSLDHHRITVAGTLKDIRTKIESHKL